MSCINVPGRAPWCDDALWHGIDDRRRKRVKYRLFIRQVVTSCCPQYLPCFMYGRIIIMLARGGIKMAMRMA